MERVWTHGMACANQRHIGGNSRRSTTRHETTLSEKNRNTGVSFRPKRGTGARFTLLWDYGLDEMSYTMREHHHHMKHTPQNYAESKTETKHSEAFRPRYDGKTRAVENARVFGNPPKTTSTSHPKTYEKSTKIHENHQHPRKRTKTQTQNHENTLKKHEQKKTSLILPAR